MVFFILLFLYRGGSRGTANYCVEEQKSNYLLINILCTPAQVFAIRLDPIDVLDYWILKHINIKTISPEY